MKNSCCDITDRGRGPSMSHVLPVSMHSLKVILDSELVAAVSAAQFFTPTFLLDLWIFSVI